MSDVINDVTRFRSRMTLTLGALERVRDTLREEHECDCPPEWPRCGVCHARLQIQAIENAIKVELAKVKL